MLMQQKAKLLGYFAVLHDRFYVQRQNEVGYLGQETKPQRQSQQIAQHVNTQEPLLKVESVFPLMLFPDSLVIDRQKVIITHREFLGKTQIINIQMNDLQSIEADIGPFFGSICITTKQYENTTHKVNMLRRKDALNAQGVLQGFVIAKQRKLDYSHVDKRELVPMLRQLGRGEPL